MSGLYILQKPFKERRAMAEKVLQKYPDRYPVIVTNKEKTQLDRFLVPDDLVVGQLMLLIRRKLSLQPSEAMFLFVNDKLLTPTTTISEEYSNDHDDDMFLYVVWSVENTFGDTCDSHTYPKPMASSSFVPRLPHSFSKFGMRPMRPPHLS